ncbi:MAG: hypothetical protein LBL76_10030 [Treponema sp.]|jgi:hypothetical protein|nr:hypothetical protein [Treponema sp.]
MEVNFTLWSLKAILDKIPFNEPVDKSKMVLDFSKIDVPYYVKHDFKVFFIYTDELRYEASCSIYSPEKKVGVVIFMKKKYEKSLKQWCTNGQDSTKQLDDCCLRRELYCHEACHLIAIIRAYPCVRSSLVRDDFLAQINKKFEKAVAKNEELKDVPISLEKTGSSPSVFDKDHFRYENDDLNYFRLYAELMFSYEYMMDAVKSLSIKIETGNSITLDDIAQQTFISSNFFNFFPEKLTALREFLAEEMMERVLS